MRKTLLTLAALAGLAGLGIAQPAAAETRLDGPQPLVQTVQYYRGYGPGYYHRGPGWRRHAWVRHHEWRRFGGYHHGYRRW